MSLNKALRALGFTKADYLLEDHGDGQGVRIVWFSASPQPTAQEIEAATQIVADETARIAGIHSDADCQELTNRLAGASAAQIKTYVQNNVTDLASAKVLLAKMLLVMSDMARKQV